MVGNGGEKSATCVSFCHREVIKAVVKLET